MDLSRRRLLRGGIAATSLFFSARYTPVLAQSEGATEPLGSSRRALVIGNADYRSVPRLANPANDAKAIAAVLGEHGFAVTMLIDADHAQIAAAIAEYARALSVNKAVGVFYFAGHGLQLAWHNYLVPVDASIRKLEDIPSRSVDLTNLLIGLEKADNRMNVVILDACRNNPFGDFRIDQRGLSQIDAPAKTLLAYATAPGNVASDGEGQNGLYTENLVREMRVREAKIEDLFKRVRLSVRRATNGKQIPWESTSLEEDFYFIPPENLKKLSPAEERRLFVDELTAFEKARDANDASLLTAYLQRYPSGRFAELAQLLLDRMLARQGERPIEIASSQGNPFSQGTARADTRFKVGDSYTERVIDRLRGEERLNKLTVVAIRDSEVVFDNGFICDPLGNVIRRRDGQRYSPRQDIPLEYAVGKRWSSRFEILSGGQGTINLDFHIAGRERITVPAGTFDCFRIEGRGVNQYVFRPQPIEYQVTLWRAPEQVRLAVAHEQINRAMNQNSRTELVSFHQD